MSRRQDTPQNNQQDMTALKIRADKYAKDREARFESQLETNIKKQKVEKDKNYMQVSSYDADEEYSTLNISEEEHKKFTLKGMSSEQLLKERKRYN